MNIDSDRMIIFLGIMARVTGLFLFNPIFGRRNIPGITKVGLSFLIAIIIFNTYPTGTGFGGINLLEFIYIFLKEFAIGYIIGFIIQLFLGAIIFAGETIDMQIGLSMGKLFDPSTGTSISMTSSFMNYMFILIFFATNSHLTLINFIAVSFNAVPVGMQAVNWEISTYITELFSLLLLYSLKISMPIIAAELISESGVGLVMKAVPQIQIFMINIQLKILIGAIVIFTMVPVMGRILENMISLIFSNIEHSMQYFV